MPAYTDEEGKFAVRTARKVVEFYLEKENIPYIDFPKKFEKESGVFTTISTYPARELRGCIGYPEPVLPLKDALIQSALSAAFSDPRFPPLRKNEINNIVFEVSLLTPPEEIKVEDRKELLNEVKIGLHGLIAERGFYRGLLLPQVPVEWKWDVKEFLEQTCWKAGLPRDCWLDRRTKFYRFTAEIFEEEEPRGSIRRKKLEA
ncbi:MAG: TIGR00296 family protein [Thermoplasmata archaeon]|nr:TIGR00296 family protein [Thermoplasmata archaeon]